MVSNSSNWLAYAEGVSESRSGFNFLYKKTFFVVVMGHYCVVLWSNIDNFCDHLLVGLTPAYPSRVIKPPLKAYTPTWTEAIQLKSYFFTFIML